MGRVSSAHGRRTAARDEERAYLWEHWKLNADQRLRGFNFFVAFAVFADGGVIAAIDKKLPPLVVLTMGVLVAILSISFWLFDVRSRQLLGLSERGLKRLELGLPEDARLFHADELKRHRWVRFTFAFRLIYVAQTAVGLATCVVALARLC